MKLEIRSINGSTKNIEFHKDTTVFSLKTNIEKEFGDEVSKQRLIFRGKELLDHQVLTEVPLVDQSIVHLAMRVLKVSEDLEQGTDEGDSFIQVDTTTELMGMIDIDLITQSTHVAMLSLLDCMMLLLLSMGYMPLFPLVVLPLAGHIGARRFNKQLTALVSRHA